MSAEADTFTLYYPAFYQMSDHPNVQLKGGNGNESWEFVAPYSGAEPLPVVDVVVEGEATGETKSAAVHDTHPESDFVSIPLAKAGFPAGMGRQRLTVSIHGNELARIEVNFGAFGDAYRLGKNLADREGARRRAGKCERMGGFW